MTKEHFDDLSDGATLFAECQGGAPHPPGPIRTRQAQAPTGVQHIAHNGPGSNRISFNSETKTKELKHPRKSQDVGGSIMFVPAQGIGVVDVRQQGGPSRPGNRGGPAVGQ